MAKHPYLKLFLFFFYCGVLYLRKIAVHSKKDLIIKLVHVKGKRKRNKLQSPVKKVVYELDPHGNWINEKHECM